MDSEPPQCMEPDRVRVELRNSINSRVDILECNLNSTIEDVKRLLPPLWQPDTLDASGVRCISRGQLLNNDVKLIALAQETENTVVIHISIRPDALHPAEPPSAQPSTSYHNASHSASNAVISSTSNAARTSDDPLIASGYFREEHSVNPLQEFIARLLPSELLPLLYAQAVTHMCYAKYYIALEEARHGSSSAPRLTLPPTLDLTPACDALNNPPLRSASVSFVELEVMQWDSLASFGRSNTTHPAQSRRQPTSDSLSTFLETASQEDIAALQSSIEARMNFLNDAMLTVLRLHDMHQGRTQHNSSASSETQPDVAREWAADIRAVLQTLTSLVIRGVVVGALLAVRGPQNILWYIGASLCVYIIAHTVILVRARRRQRMESADSSEPNTRDADAGQQRSESANTGTSSDNLSQNGSDADAMLDMPKLPSRVSQAPKYSLDYWEHMLAYYGLAEEEHAIGFEHVANTRDIQQITWTSMNFSEASNDQSVSAYMSRPYNIWYTALGCDSIASRGNLFAIGQVGAARGQR
ncbi:hypothetical protein MYAM1_001302 [Malassezia yamatoensis]|uniref:Ubiquitin-like domain-containing protein n=1 Tax=Malassezia yamatoensis TaxID=253288 RepID=A0AAJ5YVX8_9BASI|nr:hypothetical protein MYAM1_001302 [Malassezia yamatoensis]